MKKISRAIINFFKAIFNFFDKWLITPITKLFVNCSRFFSNRGSRFEKFLVNRQTLVVVSLIFALITFYAIEEKHVSLIDNSAEVLYNQKVNVKYNEASLVVEGVPDEVDVTFIGRKMDVYLAKQYPFDGVTLDLTGYTPGSYSVGFKYEQAVPSVDYKIDPSSVNIRIYEKLTAHKEVSTDIIHKDNLDSKLYIDSVVLDTDNVTVNGAAHRLEEVASVKAMVDVNKITNVAVGTTTLSDIPLIAYDSEGNKLDLEIVPATVSAAIKITSPNKEVPVKLEVKGELDGVAIQSLTPSVSSVIVYGNQEVINTIEYLPVTVDVSGVKEDKTYSINLTKPTGIREISVKTLTVELKVGEIISRDVASVPINAVNLGNGYSVQVVGEQNRMVSVIVNGSENAVNKIDVTGINAYVDLSGLTEGEHTVQVQVKGNDTTVTYTPRVKEIKVVISKAK